MKEIEINVTDRGWEMLVDGVPSPRFTRYMRMCGSAWACAKGISAVLVAGPAKALCCAGMIWWATGFLSVSVHVGDRTWPKHVAFNFVVKGKPPAAAPGCLQEESAPSPNCRARQAAPRQADMRISVLFAYLIGAWYELEKLLKKLWPKHFERG